MFGLAIVYPFAASAARRSSSAAMLNCQRSAGSVSRSALSKPPP